MAPLASTAPAHAAGVTDVRVTTPGGTSAIAAGDSHSCTVREDDTLACWGDDFGAPQEEAVAKARAAGFRRRLQTTLAALGFTGAEAGIAVEQVLAKEGLDLIPVHAALCFVNSEWGWFAKPFSMNGVWVTWPERLTELVLEWKAIPEAEFDTLARAIAARLAS